MTAKVTRGELVMGNFLCQIDGAAGCPDIWSNISVWEGVSRRD